MAIAFSQSSSTQPTGGGTATQVRLANTAANALILGGTWGTGNATGVAVSDTAGNSWVTAYTASDGVNVQSTGLWYAANIAAASVNTVTLTTPAATDFRGAALHEYSGVLTSSPSDGTDLLQASVTAISANTVTTTQNGDLLFGWCVNTGGTNVLTATNSAITRERTTVGVIFASADSIQGASGAGNITWSVPVADTTIAGMLALKAPVTTTDDILVRYGSMGLTDGSGLVTAAFQTDAGAAVAGGGLLLWYEQNIVEDLI